MTDVPPAVLANSASKVAGGHTMRSTSVSWRASSMIANNSDTEACSPFIFQLPAISGRRGMRAMFLGLSGDQLRDLGYWRHFPRVWSLDRDQDRSHGDRGRAAPSALQRAAAALFET